MASNCEDVSAQMMELLYGELPADARASVDAHVAGCARCRAELDGFEKTRALARRGLDEAPPARVHAAIMQAAAAHLATQAQAQPAAAARKPAAPETASFWDRLRARWAFPTLATVGAVAVFMVANRVFLNPERTLEQRPAAVEAPAAAVAHEPGAGAEPSEPKMQDEAKPAGEAQGEREARLDRRRGPGDDDARAHHGKWAVGGEGRAEMKKAKKGGDAEDAFAARPAASARAEAPAKEKVARDAPAENKFAPPPPPREGAPAGQWADKAAAPLDDADLPRADSSRSAAAAAKPAPARKAPAQALGNLDDLLGGAPGARAGGGSASGKGALGGLAAPRAKSDGYGAGAAQPAPRPAPVASVASVAAAPAAAAPATPPPAALAKARAKKSEAAAEESYEAAPEAMAAKDEKKVATKTSANSGNDAIMQRADRLFADGRWAEAAALYRELLRREPRNDDAERWRRRLVAAEAAEVNERNAAVAAKRAAPRAEKAEAAKPAAKAPAKASKAAAADSAQ